MYAGSTKDFFWILKNICQISYFFLISDSADHESDPHCDLNESVQRLESKYAEARSEESMDIDLNDSVQRLEAKCAGVREELGRMALSEQYMRTKQAQLRARKKELEAKEATIKAELREKEAYVSIKNILMSLQGIPPGDPWGSL